MEALTGMSAMALAKGAGGLATGMGIGLFSYNKGNYSMDQKLHYARYVAAKQLAIAQVGQYRQDIADMTDLTCKRMDTYHTVAGMALTILTALFCPGRLGLHTPPPPGWLMGLFMVNLAGAYLWLILTMWLSMHASLRADSAATHMLTRFVRLPIPSSAMLDRARKFLASWEAQPVSEIWRIPFTRHRSSEQKHEGGFNEDIPMDTDASVRCRHGYDVPAWYKKEKTVDNGYPVESMSSKMPLIARGSAPEHFEAYREVQNDWWPYDVYARLSIFLAFMHLLHCWTYMQIGHHLQETRSVFAAATVVVPISVLQQIILTLDILVPKGQVPVHRIGPVAQIVAYVAAAIEYRRWYSSSWATVSYILVYLAYGIHIIYTISLLVLCAPDINPPPRAEVPSKSWWPQEWRLPTAFQHACWLMAPPRKLEEGQHDLAGEMRDAAHSGATDGRSFATTEQTSSQQKRQDVHNFLGRQGESPAWRHVQIGLVALLLAWIWLTVGYTVEVVNQGTKHPSLLSAPGIPNQLRDPRYRKPKPGAKTPVEVGTGGAKHGPGVGEGHHRVLSELEEKNATLHEMACKLRDLAPHLHQVASGAITVPQHSASPQSSNTLVSLAPMPVRWPALFEPRLLACQHTDQGSQGLAVAMSHHGRGATLTAAGSSWIAEPFLLEGITSYGPLLAATWDIHGLLLVTSSGITLECSGQKPEGGRWRCQPIRGAKLPIGAGGQHFDGVVAVSRLPMADGAVSGLRAAIIFPGEATVTIFQRQSGESSPWLPMGEARIPSAASAATFVKEALLLLQANGQVARLDMLTGGVSSAAIGVKTEAIHAWQSGCNLGDGTLVRLALRPSSLGILEPALFVGA